MEDALDSSELLERIAAIYGTDFTDIPPYGGPEAGAGLVDLVVDLWRWWRGERWPDASVGELHQAVKAGSWREAFPDKVWPVDSD